MASTLGRYEQCVRSDTAGAMTEDKFAQLYSAVDLYSEGDFPNQFLKALENEAVFSYPSRNETSLIGIEVFVK